MLDAVDSGDSVDAQAPYLIGFHDRVGGIESPAADERKEGEGGLAELERLVVLIHKLESGYEGSVGWKRLRASVVTGPGA